MTGPTTNQVIHIDFIAQGKPSENAWSTFILDSPEGFTRAGVPRLNESIRVYSWSILDAQAQTKTGILGTGTAFGAQKQFIVNVEDSINAPVDLPEEIQRYQDTLRYARTKVNFAFGIGLYMCPSNLEMQIGTIQGYNNEIIIATEQEQLGINPDINPMPLKGKESRTQGTGTPRSLPEPLIEKPKLPEIKKEEKEDAQEHEDQKSAMVIGFVALASAIFIFFY